MLTFYGRRKSLCDGLARRDFLQLGALGLGGLTLPQLLQAEAKAGVSGKSHKAVIMIYMCGAPSHQDTFDLKMNAPSEIRGEFKPIDTAVPGIQICEHLPLLARSMDKLVPIRSVVGSPNGAHDSYICYTGHSIVNQPQGGWPSLGSATAKILGKVDPAVPPFVGLSPKAGHPPYGSPGLPGFLGPAMSAFRPSGEGREDMTLNGITPAQLSDRRSLLTSLDRMRREIDSSGAMSGLDAFQQQALGLLTSSRLAEALDLSREDQRVRDRYGKGFTANFGDGAPRNLEHFLTARRLVEAGCRVVTLNFGRWDFHSDEFNGMKNTHLPPFDQGMSALVEDLHERGLDKDVAVVAWGEFGRTPMINKDAGRDHWPQVGCALLAGGNWRRGQTIGATDRLGGAVTERPVHFGEVLASLYRHLGIDPSLPHLRDLSGRPQFLVEGHQPLPELV